MNLSNATKTAIAAVARLAANYDAGNRPLSAARIAAERDLKGPFVAKVLSQLARSGIVRGVTGPGGGFCLARPPETISVAEVVALIEPADLEPRCPFGWGVCGTDRPCPLHDAFIESRAAMLRFFEVNHFGIFRDETPDPPEP